jgi:DNA-binding CsgD family transcriptional regulator
MYQWHQLLARVILAVNDESFVIKMAEAIASLTSVESVQFALECRSQAPVLLYESGIPARTHDSLIGRYFASGYVLDPLCLAVQSGLAEGFYHLSEVAPDSFLSSEYYRNFYVANGLAEDCYFIVDLDVTRKISFCLFQGESGDRFSHEQLELFRAIEPVVRELIYLFGQGPGLSCLAEHSNNRSAAGNKVLMNHIRGALSGFGKECLTEREREVAHLILRGHSTKSAAKALGLSSETIRMHRRNLYSKLRINSQAELFANFIASLAPDAVFLEAKHDGE